MTFIIEPWVIGILKALAYYVAGWMSGAFIRWLDKETNN